MIEKITDAYLLCTGGNEEIEEYTWMLTNSKGEKATIVTLNYYEPEELIGRKVMILIDGIILM
jgi:hypothetical protein